MIARLAVVGALLAAARVAGAQAVRVEVRDSVSGEPVPWAVVSLQAGDSAVTEAVTRARGVVVLRPDGTGTYRLRVRRVGQRPYLGPALALAPPDTAHVVLRVPRAPVSLSAVAVAARGTCGSTASPAVAELWEAARTALAGAVAAREDAPGGEALLFERALDVRGRVEASAESPIAWAAGGRPFTSADPETLERLGYVVGDLHADASFHAPDERAVLSEGFVRTHCFAPAGGRGATAGWAGVRFTPVPGRRVADIAGVVWLDTATAELRRIEFAYVWRAIPREARGLGGATDFARLPSGAVGVRAWRVRLPRLLELDGRLYVAGYRERGGSVRAAAP